MSVTGVGFAVLLVLVMAGIFVGTINQVTTYIDHSRNAVGVTQPGCPRCSARCRGCRRGQAASAVRTEVASADPILGQPSDFVHNGEQTAYFVLGYDTATGVGGPWKIVEGRAVAGPGKSCPGPDFARKNGIHLGDAAEIVDGTFTVVGLGRNRGTGQLLRIHPALPEAARLLRAGDRVSYFPGSAQARLHP